MSLKEAASAKGYSITRGWPGDKLHLMEKTTGKIVARYESTDELRAALESLAPCLPRDKEPGVSVGWALSPQLTPIPPKKCSNGYGSQCLCISPTEWVFCCIRTCHLRAACLGSCGDHLGAIKILGDFTEQAYLHTQTHENDGDLEELKETAPKKVSIKLENMVDTSGSDSLRPGDLASIGKLLGVNVRNTGNGYTIIDRDGIVLGRHPDRSEILGLFLFDEI